MLQHSCGVEMKGTNLIHIFWSELGASLANTCREGARVLSPHWLVWVQGKDGSKVKEMQEAGRKWGVQ